MTWWQLTMVVVSGIVIIAGGIAITLGQLWARQERRDGLK